MAIDPATRSPSNLGFALALHLRNKKTAKEMYALIPMPSGVRRFVELPSRSVNDRGRPERRFIPLETVMAMYLDTLFPGHDVLAQGAFRVIRDSDIEVEEESEDLVLEFEKVLKQRRRGVIVRPMDAAIRTICVTSSPQC